MSLQPIATHYPYTKYICYQIFVLSPCAHMDLPSSPLSIRNKIISEIRCSGVEWSSILSFHVCKKNALPMIDNLGTFVWQNRFRGHMSLSCHRNDIAEKKHVTLHSSYNTLHICLHMFAQYVFFLQPKHVTTVPFYINKKRSDWICRLLLKR